MNVQLLGNDARAGEPRSRNVKGGVPPTLDP